MTASIRLGALVYIQTLFESVAGVTELAVTSKGSWCVGADSIGTTATGWTVHNVALVDVDTSG
jgi:hypothetical protein